MEFEPPASVRLVQDKQEFLPYVMPVLVGTRVELVNQDTVEHHGYSQSQAKKFNIALHKPGTTQSVLFDQPGAVAIGCNIHDWMIAYVVVVETPLFAKTEAGKATIRRVPAGKYEATIWHPQLAAPVTRELTVTDEAKTESFTLTLRPDRRIRRPASADDTYKP